MDTAPVIDPGNIQGLVRAGYKHLLFARFVLFQLDPTSASADRRRWLGALPVTSAGGKDATRALNLAVTPAGLRALGVSEDDLRTFPEVFVQGMARQHRQRLLGDHSESEPARWVWGQPEDPARPRPELVIHGVLLCYAVDPSALHTLVTEVMRGPVREVHSLHTEWLEGAKEHFGFRDGMGQPEIAGLHPHQPWKRPIATGEFLLGHDNEYRERPHSPTVGGDPSFGHDGTYLVMRQLQQHVGRFWEFVRRKAGEMHVAERFPDADDPVMLLAAKMVGRWPGGAPLALSPHRDDPALAEADVFDYSDDPDGMRCPFGSHVRRSNPRNWFLGPNPSQSMDIASRHRILRRGRAYGPPLERTMDTARLAHKRDDNVERGLHFLCLNANIERQFEVAQHNWLNNPKFGGLHGGADPVVGDHDPETSARDLPREFLIPAAPARCRVTDLQRFVTVRGGAYFFMPSLAALAALAK